MRVFVYGSLMDPDSRPRGVEAEPGVLKGYVRSFSHRNLKEKTTALTLVPRMGREILGYILTVTKEQDFRLDRRENGYREVVIDGMSVFLSDHELWASSDYPVLRSYFESVVRGAFLRDGMDNLVQSVLNWDFPLKEDVQHLSPLVEKAIRPFTQLKRFIA